MKKDYFYKQIIQCVVLIKIYMILLIYILILTKSNIIFTESYSHNLYCPKNNVNTKKMHLLIFM